MPKLEPPIATDDPTMPALGVKLEIIGKNVTVNVTPFEALPLTVTTTFPVVAPPGTAQESDVDDQPEQVAEVPLNVTVLEPCNEPYV